MARFAIFAVAATMFVFASSATAQDPGATSAPDSAGQGQYQYDPEGPSTQQAIEKGIEDAIEDARENDAAVDGTEAYVESFSPEEAEAVEPEEESVASASPSASSRYQSLPDTGGVSLPFAGAFAVFLAGAWITRKVHTKSD